MSRIVEFYRGTHADSLGRMLADIFRDEGAGDVMSAYRRILDGEQARVHEHRRLRKEQASENP